MYQTLDLVIQNTGVMGAKCGRFRRLWSVFRPPAASEFYLHGLRGKMHCSLGGVGHWTCLQVGMFCETAYSETCNIFTGQFVPKQKTISRNSLWVQCAFVWECFVPFRRVSGPISRSATNVLKAQQPPPFQASYTAVDWRSSYAHMFRNNSGRCVRTYTERRRRRRRPTDF